MDHRVYLGGECELPVPPALWRFTSIDWENSCVSVPWHEALEIRGVDPGLVDAAKRLQLETARCGLRDTAVRFVCASVKVKVQDLLRIFPHHDFAQGSGREMGRRGRTPTYNWPELFAEIAVRADLDGLPASLAELMREVI